MSDPSLDELRKLLSQKGRRPDGPRRPPARNEPDQHRQARREPSSPSSQSTPTQNRPTTVHSYNTTSQSSSNEGGLGGGIVFLVFIFIIYNIFISSDDEPVKSQNQASSSSEYDQSNSKTEVRQTQDSRLINKNIKNTQPINVSSSVTRMKCGKSTIFSQEGDVAINSEQGTKKIKTNWRKIYFTHCFRNNEKYIVIAEAFGNNAKGILVFEPPFNEKPYGCVLHSKFRAFGKKLPVSAPVKCNEEVIRSLQEY